MFATSTEDLAGNPLADALRALREEDKTLVQIANMYKDDANQLIKKAKGSSSSDSLHEAVNTYMHAVSFVDEAVEARTRGTEAEEDREVDLLALKSQLFSNIAQVWLTLKNFRSCITEADAAIAIWKGNAKAHYRKCKALLALKKFDECLAACNASAEINSPPEQAFIDEIAQTCSSELQRKSALELQNRQLRLVVQKEWAKIWIHVVKRNAELQQTQQTSSGKRLSSLITFGFCTDVYPVQLNDQYPVIDADTSVLCVPVLLLYPQYNQLDVIQAAKSDILLVEYLAEMFPEFEDNNVPVSWDVNKEYQSSRLVLYCPIHAALPATNLNEWIQCCTQRRQLQGLEGDEAADEAKLLMKNRNIEVTASTSNQRGYVEVHVGCTVEQVLRLHGCILAGGVLTLLAFVKGNAAHKDFVDKAGSQNMQLLKLQPNETVSAVKLK
jgi:hypothetical protein